MTEPGARQPDPQRKPDENYDPEMTEEDEGNTPAESGADGDDEEPVARPL